MTLRAQLALQGRPTVDEQIAEVRHLIALGTHPSTIPARLGIRPDGLAMALRRRGERELALLIDGDRLNKHKTPTREKDTP